MSTRLRYTLVLALLCFSFAFVAYRHLRKDLETRYREAVEENLVDHAQFLASVLIQDQGLYLVQGALKDLQSREFTARIYQLVKTRSNLLVYVTDAQGLVLYHSADSTQVGRDYSRWRDVYLTLHGEYGARSSRRNPDDDNSSVLYVAAPIEQDGGLVGVVTVGKPVEDFHVFLQDARHRVFWWLLGGSAVLVLLGLGAGFWVLWPLRKLEADLAAKRYVDEYTQVLTHELKSPISSILGATEILESAPDSQTTTHFLGNIRSETVRLRDLVSTMLQVAALERKDTLESSTSFTWDTLLGALRDSLEFQLRQKEIALDWPQLDAHLRGDCLLLTQALHNLLLNAIEYSPRGGRITFTVTVVRNPRQSAYLLGTICDFGPGIPDFALPRLFEKFYSLPKPGSGRKGTGLGLVFTRQTLRLHGGSVELENAMAGGACARFSLPIA